MLKNSLELKDFPVTRYQGSKRKIVPWIHNALIEKNIKFNTALDVFGGTGMVSYLFKKMGKEVAYNDCLKFNFIIGKALIENKDCRINDEEVREILNYRSSSKNLVQRLFKDIYFLDDENKWIDDTVDAIETVFKNDKAGMKKAICYYALFQACIIKRPFNLFHRKNLNLRTNDVKRNFGNKTTWETPFKDLFIKFITEANNSVFDNKKPCVSLNKSAFNIDPYGYDLIYLDPPYFKNGGNDETANYFKCYHFLEGIANYQNWDKIIDYNTPTLRIFQDNQMVLKRDEVYEKFEELLFLYRKSKIIFSYKKGGLPSIDYIVKVMKKLKKNVSTKTIHYKYALNHQNEDAKNSREVLIIGI